MEILGDVVRPRSTRIVLHRWLSLMSAVAAFATAMASSAAQTYSEESIKAAYLYRFTQYIEWPEPAATAEPFTIAVMNAPAVAEELERLLPQHPIKNATARVRAIARIQDLGSAQMLYIGPVPPDRLRSFISSLRSGSVLLVTDNEQGLELGSILNFITIERRVRFEVSLTASDKSKFRISAELLGVAARVLGGARQSDATHADAEKPTGG
jgi:hypothetical protein